MPNDKFSYHFSLSFYRLATGTLTQQERVRRLAFFKILRKSDPTDWPVVYNLEHDTLVATNFDRMCPVCKGFVYNYPRISQQHVLNLAKALDLDIRIHHFITGKTCKSKVA